MVSALDSGLSNFEPWPGHCVVFLGKTLYSRSASLYPGVCFPSIYLGYGQ